MQFTVIRSLCVKWEVDNTVAVRLHKSEGSDERLFLVFEFGCTLWGVGLLL